MQAPGARPQVKCLLEEGETIEFIENHFSIPVSLLRKTLPLVFIHLPPPLFFSFFSLPRIVFVS